MARPHLLREEIQCLEELEGLLEENALESFGDQLGTFVGRRAARIWREVESKVGTAPFVDERDTSQRGEEGLMAVGGAGSQ